MKRMICIIIIFLFGLWFAIGDANHNFEIDAGIGGSVSLVGIHLVEKAMLSYNPLDWFGVSGGIKMWQGASSSASSQWNGYFAPFAAVNLSVFYIGGGVMLSPVQDTTGFYTAGLKFGLLDLGPGKLGLDMAADIAPTLYAVDNSEADPLANAIASIIATVLGLLKIHVGINYSLIF